MKFELNVEVNIGSCSLKLSQMTNSRGWIELVSWDQMRQYRTIVSVQYLEVDIQLYLVGTRKFPGHFLINAQSMPSYM